MAMSVNGMIAEVDGSEDFLSHVNWHSFLEAAHEHGNFIVGRRTLEAVRGWGDDYGYDELTSLTRVILSREHDGAGEVGYHFVSTPRAALELLAHREFETALVTGGSATNRAFLEAGLIDRIVLNVAPAFVGQGIPLAQQFAGVITLQFESAVELPEGIVQLSYTVR
jgi:riboflavin biosynthesis pyrimidine reductase